MPIVHPTNIAKCLTRQGLQGFFHFMHLVLDMRGEKRYNCFHMKEKQRKMKRHAIERETVDGYLSRGGKITRVHASLPNDLIRLSGGECIDKMLGASYDDLFGTGVSSFYVSGEIQGAIRENTDNLNAENDYNE